MPNFYTDNADLRWYLDGGLDLGTLIRLTEYDPSGGPAQLAAPDAPASVADALAGYREILGAVGEFVGEQVAPRWRELMVAHPRLVGPDVEDAPVVRELVAALGELGLFGLNVPRELGGMNAPMLVFQLSQEMLARADTSLCAHVGFHGGIAMASLLYSVLEGSATFQTQPPRIENVRFRELLDEIVAGKAWGSMDITEPGAGSDMAALRTRGRQLEDGSWRVTGEKLFITSGHGRWHFVIARTEDAPIEPGATEADSLAGLKGLSLFLVKAWDWGPDGEKFWRASFTGVEDKLGHTASATVSIAYEDSPAELVGERGRGFQQMLVLMNNARISVGFECLGVAEAAWRAAKAYASTRPSMGKTIDRHEMIAEILENMETDIQAIRALAVTAAMEEEISQKVGIALRLVPVDAARKAELEALQRRARRRSRSLTPLLKWYAAERCVEITRESVQVHGGSGYIRETGVERLLRDAMVFPIYEGTSQIQALMAMKDALLDVVRNPARFVNKLGKTRWRSVATRDPDLRAVATLRLRALQAIEFLVGRLGAAKVRELPLSQPGAWAAAMQKFDPKRDFGLAMLHAERLCGLLTDAAIAEILADQVSHDASRRPLLQRWIERAVPRAEHRYTLITTTGSRLLQQLGR